MTFSNPIVISQKIQQDSLIRLKAFFASVGVHGSVAAALLYLSFNEPNTIPTDGKPIMISLAGYTPAGKSSESAVRKVPLPKKAAHKPRPEKQKLTAAETAQEQHQHKSAAPALTKPLMKEEPVAKPVSTPQTIPSLDPAVLSEASSPQPAEMRPGVAPSPLEPTTDDSSSEDQNITHHSPQNAPLASANKIVDNGLSAAGIDGATLGRIRTLIENALTYPAIARKLRLEGTVMISFILKTDGLVEKIKVVTSSGSAMLDNRALQTVLALNGDYPVLPRTAFLKVPITFSLTGH